MQLSKVSIESLKCSNEGQHATSASITGSFEYTHATTCQRQTNRFSLSATSVIREY